MSGHIEFPGKVVKAEDRQVLFRFTDGTACWLPLARVEITYHEEGAALVALPPDLATDLGLLAEIAA